jgi:hypothetical protein
MFNTSSMMEMNPRARVRFSLRIRKRLLEALHPALTSAADGQRFFSLNLSLTVQHYVE